MRSFSFFNNNFYKYALIVIIINSSGCGGTRTGNPSLDAAGTATLGPVSGATVTAYVLNTDGTRGAALGSAITSSSGSYNIPLETSGPITLVMTLGSYKDEATAATVTIPAGFELEILAPADTKRANLHLHAISTIAAARAKSLIATLGLTNAHDKSVIDTANVFGLTGIDTGTIKPDNFTVSGGVPSAGANTAKLGLVISGLSQLVEDLPVAPSAKTPEKQLGLIQNIAHDYSDGDFDGFNSSGAAVPNTSFPLTPKQAINGLQTAMTNFLNSGQNASGYSSGSFTSYPSAP